MHTGNLVSASKAVKAVFDLPELNPEAQDSSR
jgi:hypothetical protein